MIIKSKKIKIKRCPKLYLFIFLIISIPSIQSFGLPIKIYGNLGGGTNVIESAIEGFYLKSMPTTTTGIIIMTKTGKRINLGLDLSFSYTFKSDYNDYFYYGPFIEIGLSPVFEIDLLKFLAIGLFGTVSPTYTNYEQSLVLKLGGYLLVPIKTRWLKSILLQYEHGFSEGYKVNEKIILKARLLIYKKN